MHNNLGAALVGLGDLTGAEAEFRRALELRPEFPEAQQNLHQLLAHRQAEAAADAKAHRRPIPKPPPD